MSRQVELKEFENTVTAPKAELSHEIVRLMETHCTLRTVKLLMI